MIEKPCLLDTDMLSYILKELAPVYQISREYLRKYEAFTISCITYYECLRGYRAIGATKRLEDFYRLLIFTEVLYLDRPIFDTASDMYGILKKQGTLPGELDILVAATAIEHDHILVTNNEKHYKPIQAHFPLHVCNWMTEQVSFSQAERSAEEKTAEATSEQPAD
jgi:tRNA(fMet)-specific endonuclease VapC